MNVGKHRKLGPLYPLARPNGKTSTVVTQGCSRSAGWLPGGGWEMGMAAQLQIPRTSDDFLQNGATSEGKL